MAQTVLVTGIRGGIGSACASILTERGLRVVGTSHTPEGLNALRQDKRLVGYYQLDLTNVPSMQQTFHSIVKEHGQIDILINNAAMLAMASIFDITEDIWNETLAVNLKSAFFLSQVAASYMRQQRTGTIINIASLAGKEGFVDQICYSAAKAGILSLTRILARELAEWNIRVHAVSPGAIDTQLFRHCLSWSSTRYGIDERTMLTSWLAPSANRTLISPNQVAKVVCYLAIEGGLELSGCCWDIDGGVAY